MRPQHSVRILCDQGRLDAALNVVERMCRHETQVPDEVFCSLLQECLRRKDLAIGRQAHALIIRCGCYPKSVLKNNLIRMFAACGSLAEAKQVFGTSCTPDVYTWQAILSAHVACGHSDQAIDLYHKLRSSSVKPNDYVYVAVLKACATAAMVAQGRVIHNHILQSGNDVGLHVGSILVDMYAKCGCVREASKMFDSLPTRDLVLCNAMIAAYAQHGLDKEALWLFEKMQAAGIAPDTFTFACVFKVCGSAGCTEDGKHIHSLMLKTGCSTNSFVGNTLIDMYGKCGLLQEAKHVFDDLGEHDVVSWTAMMNAHEQLNNWKLTIQCFEEMQRQSVKPDGAAFRSVLTACSHAGLVNEGQRYFHKMKGHYGITPTVDHIICMADLLARSGQLHEAEKLLLSTPSQHDVGWTSLLTACKSHGNVELGRRCFDHAVKINPTYGSGYVLMSSIYADAQMWEHVYEIEELRKCAGV